MKKYRYVGGGAFFHGVPARDLTELDWERLTPEQQKLVRTGTLYEAVVQAKKTKKEE